MANEKIMLDRIYKSLDAMIKVYEPGAKSRHWQKFFTEKTIADLRDYETLRSFRSNRLKSDLHDQTSWLGTAHAFKRLTAVTGGGGGGFENIQKWSLESRKFGAWPGYRSIGTS
jgi:hypothetical protein